MQKELIRKLGVVILVLFIGVSLVSFILELNDIQIYAFYLYFYIFKIFFIVVCFIVFGKYRIKTIFFGLLLTTFALVYDLFELFEYVSIEEHVILFLITHKTFNLLGTILIVYGLWSILIRNDALLNKLKTLAYYDTITHLPNRNLLLKKCPIKDMIQCSKQNCVKCILTQYELLDQHEKTFIFIDIDNFKYINDNLGHVKGDQLLKNIADRLKTCITKDDSLIHLSGDEFLMILNQIPKSIEQFTSKVFTIINQPYHVNQIDIHITCSVGVAYYPLHGNTTEELIYKADIAMYEAKKEGKNNYFVYSPTIEKSFNKKFELISELVYAINHDEFLVYYQVKASVETGEITGLEALARWNHGKKGIIYPNDFIPLSEETGYIKEIDTMILKKVCQQINKWVNEGKQPYNISVNISPIFFMDKHFISTLDELITFYQIDPLYLSIEVTENVALRYNNQTKLILSELKKRNIRVLLDDFGRGYSSFNYISEFNVDSIKIDKTFINEISHSPVSQTLVQAIVSLSHQLGFKVIPEGVETIEQLKRLKELGCHEYQGYYLNKPQPIEEIDLKF